MVRKKICPDCNSEKVKKDGVIWSKIYREKRQKYKCLSCSKKFSFNTYKIDESAKLGIRFDRQIMKALGAEFLSVRDLQKKFRKNRRTILASLARIASYVKGGFIPADYYLGWTVEIKPVAIKDKPKKKLFQAEVKLGFSNRGPIVDAGLGPALENLSSEWVEKNNFEKWVNARSEDWVMNRLALFVIHYNTPFFSTKEDLAEFNKHYPQQAKFDEFTKDLIKKKRGNRHKKSK